MLRPLLASELNMQPFIKHVQGPTADFSVNVVYANFTILNSSKPVSENDGPASSYYVVLNVTNISDIGAKLLDVNFVAASQGPQGPQGEQGPKGAKLLDVNFVAAREIKNISESMPSWLMNSTSGSGYFAEGAWVDGIWYNVTLATHNWPAVD